MSDNEAKETDWSDYEPDVTFYSSQYPTPGRNAGVKSESSEDESDGRGEAPQGEEGSGADSDSSSESSDDEDDDTVIKADDDDADDNAPVVLTDQELTELRGRALAQADSASEVNEDESEDEQNDEQNVLPPATQAPTTQRPQGSWKSVNGHGINGDHDHDHDHAPSQEKSSQQRAVTAGPSQIEHDRSNAALFMTPPSMLRKVEKRRNENAEGLGSPEKRARSDPYQIQDDKVDGTQGSVPVGTQKTPDPASKRITPASSKRKQQSKATFAQRSSESKKKTPKPKVTPSKTQQPILTQLLLSSQPSPSLPPSSQPRASQSTSPQQQSSRLSSTRPSTTPSAASTPFSKTFSKEEVDQMTAAVDKYRDRHKLSQTQVNDMIQQSIGVGRSVSSQHPSSKLWSYIIAAVPGKPRHKVITFCRKNFHNFKARGGHWTPEEEAELAQLVKTGGTKWSQWSKIMNRHPEDLRDRYRNYVICGDNRGIDRWDDDEEERLRKYVVEATEAIELAQYDNPHDPFYKRPIEQLIDWQEISSRLGRTRSRLQCLSKWKKMKDSE